MTQGTGGGPTPGTRFAGIWQATDAQVASGRIPGYVAAVRVGDEVAVRAGGRTAVETDSAPMRAETLFRIASLTKQLGGALTLSLCTTARSPSTTPSPAGCPRRRARACWWPPTPRSTAP